MYSTELAMEWGAVNMLKPLMAYIVLCNSPVIFFCGNSNPSSAVIGRCVAIVLMKDAAGKFHVL